MTTHAKCLGPLRAKPFKIEDDTYCPIIGRFSNVEVECSSCHSPLLPDRNARWATFSPPRYLVKGTQHICKQTTKSNRKLYAIPKDKTIPFTLSGSLSRKAENPAAIKSKRWQELFVRTDEDDEGLPEEVETCCEACKSPPETLNLNSRGCKVIDQDPLWTVQNPPRYILHRRTCPACKGNWKFLPVNPHIPSIPMKTLRDLEQSYQHVADSVAVDALAIRYPVPEWIANFKEAETKNKEREFAEIDKVSVAEPVQD